MDNVREERLFKIGAVARMTGVSIHSIRKWEERYGAVEPGRSEGGKRLYSDVDVQRLTLMKQLANSGIALENLAKSSLSQLNERWAKLRPTVEPGATPSRVAVFGAGLAASLQLQASQLGTIEVVAAASDEAEMRRKLKDVEADVLFVECPAVAADTEQRISDLLERFDLPAAVVVYRFGARRHVDSLRSWRVVPLRAPAEFSTLQQAVARLHTGADIQRRSADLPLPPDTTDDSPRPPRFSREALATMALSNPQATCECQRNLVDVVLSLRALEEYLCGCESRSPEDEALHNALWNKVCEARTNIEDAIEHFAAVEGIPLQKQ